MIIVIWLISCLWGTALTFCGLTMMIILRCKGHRPKLYKGFIYFEVGEKWGGINLGPIFIVNKGATEHILKHELGHGLQNMVYGWLMPFIVAIPSVTRAQWRKRIRAVDYARYLTLPKYEDIWFERQATQWGYKFCSFFGDEDK